MVAEVVGVLDQIRKLCALHRVRRMHVFGSAAAGDFDPAGPVSGIA